MLPLHMEMTISDTFESGVSRNRQSEHKRVLKKLRRSMIELSLIFQCEECFQQFHDNESLDNHYREQHANQPEFECETCYDVFRSQELLQSHLQIHAEENGFTCELCNREIPPEPSVKRYRMIPRFRSSNTCSICRTKFSCKRTYNNHMAFHMGKCRFDCKHCHEVFPERCFLHS